MQTVKITVTDGEKDKIAAAASRLGLSVAAFVRMSALQAAQK